MQVIRTALVVLATMGVVVCASQAATWQVANPTVIAAKSLARDSSGRLFAGSSADVFLSVDNGASWQVYEDSSKYADCFAIEFDAVSNYLFISVETGVYRSNNNGLTWDFLGDEVVGAYSMEVSPNGHLWVSGSGGTFVSDNNGDSWTHVHAPLGQFGDGLTITTAGTLLESTLLEGLFRTTNNGQNWSFISGPFRSPHQTTALTSGRSAGLAFAADFITDQFSHDTLTIYRSTDDGVSWSQVHSKAQDLCHVLYADSKGNLFAGRNEVFRSPDNGNTWAQYSDGLPFETQVRCFIEAANGMLIAGGDDFIYRINADSGLVIDPPVCCAGLAGNVDCDISGGTDIADLSALIDYLYISFSPLCCKAEANVDGQPGIDISDLSALIDYLYISFAPPAACQ